MGDKNHSVPKRRGERRNTQDEGRPSGFTPAPSAAPSPATGPTPAARRSRDPAGSLYARLTSGTKTRPRGWEKGSLCQRASREHWAGLVRTPKTHLS